MKTNIICDLDGTLADVRHRLHYIKNPDGTLKPYAERDWDRFNFACVDDAPYEEVIQILLQLERVDCRCYYRDCGCEWEHNNIYILSGRNEVVRAETTQWLQKHVDITGGAGGWNPDTHLIMRGNNDRRHDTEVKLEMVQKLGLTPENTLCVFDDRQSVVDMWRTNGFRCLQVNAWEE